MMANISEYSIVAYQRKPGCWRAAITRKVRSGDVVEGDKMRIGRDHHRQFRDAGGSYDEYGAAVKAAITHGLITLASVTCLPVVHASWGEVVCVVNVR
jgi:hypothetical protein